MHNLKRQDSALRHFNLLVQMPKAASGCPFSDAGDCERGEKDFHNHRPLLVQLCSLIMLISAVVRR